MEYILMILGWMVAVEGIFYIYKPKLLPQALDFFSKGNRIYFLSVMWTAVAAIMLIGAKECPQRLMMTILGLILMSAALLTFAATPPKLAAALHWLKTKPLILIRFLGAIETAFGLLIVYAAS